MDARRTVGLRFWVGTRITAGVIIWLAGSIFAGLGNTGGGGSLIISLAIWTAFFFAGLFVALQGVIRLIEVVVMDSTAAG